MAISPQRLTIYLYSAHRAVIFEIAQLSCFTLAVNALIETDIMSSHRLQLLLITVRFYYCVLIVGLFVLRQSFTRAFMIN